MVTHNAGCQSIRDEWPVTGQFATSIVRSMSEEQTPPGLRILLIDPHDQVRRSLARRLQDDERVAIVAEASSAHEASPIVAGRAPNVAIIDPVRADADWRDGLEELVVLRQSTDWFLIAMHVARHGDLDAAEALRIGADVYVLKGMRTDRLLSLLTSQLALIRPAWLP